MSQSEIFISNESGRESKSIADESLTVFQNNGLIIIRNKRDLALTALSILMKRPGQASTIK